MIIGFLREKDIFENRSMLLPEHVSSIIKLGFKILVEKDYAKKLGLEDEMFIKVGAEVKSESDITSLSDIIIKISGKNLDSYKFKDGTIVITAFFDKDNDKLFKLKNDNNIKIFGLNYLPRITRAQAMDVLSSQSNLAGYKAVIDTAYEFSKALPMMMTAAGTITPAKYFIVGAGVAGLQAIATAKRLGAVVSATDVRLASKEQVESLGAKFVFVDSDENLETEGGYAKEATKNYKKKQEELIKQTVKNQDVIITTALIPGRKAPLIINEEMVLSMKPGSVICDLATSQGGNVAFSERDKVIEKNGIKIIGYSNYASRTSYSASSLLTKNIINFLTLLVNKDSKTIDIDYEDEIIKGVKI
ncbi:MAG: NAD(P)(+) transhydrogenase (Re/Si-specific) subunit alpha [Candidatus Pelagibacter sp.]|nr:NAD(P)(+) transhydrogenase (Re/Si-specific) subunit alpha [Candidatus Pelagibacter sp.]|tara:strand:- start:17532 stop:18611 length:1080 start_codon:yes stop_codon:yes gene_type:complete